MDHTLMSIISELLPVIIYAFVFAGFSAVLIIIPFWKICSKAGFPSALSLLMLLPFVNVILPFYIAFAQWPSLDKQKKV